MLFKVFTKLGDIAISEKGKKPTTLINEKKSGYIPYINIEAFEMMKEMSLLFGMVQDQGW
jgi:hypothetical protein